MARGPLILDDQALVVSLGDRGLVILSGCGHAGIVNTVRYARKLTGNDAVAAIVGGFPPQRSDVRADHRAHGRCARRAITLASGARPLHGLESGTSARDTVPRRVRHEHRRHQDHALIQQAGERATRRRGALLRPAARRGPAAECRKSTIAGVSASGMAMRASDEPREHRPSGRVLLHLLT
jgi:hypothetical protein